MQKAKSQQELKATVRIRSPRETNDPKYPIRVYIYIHT